MARDDADHTAVELRDESDRMPLADQSFEPPRYVGRGRRIPQFAEELRDRVSIAGFGRTDDHVTDRSIRAGTRDGLAIDDREDEGHDRTAEQ